MKITQGQLTRTRARNSTPPHAFARAVLSHLFFLHSIYLIDHAWTYRVEHARAQLEGSPRLLGRMANLMDLTTDGKNKQALVHEVLAHMWK